MLVGADNTAVEISPNPDRELAGPVHQIMLVVNGIHLLENLKLDELAAKRATSSPRRPAAQDQAAPDRRCRSRCDDQNRSGRSGVSPGHLTHPTGMWVPC
jgi:hypothetical protein